jgi:hypothetical protein
MALDGVNAEGMPQSYVKVISRTWARDSHDLFDFEAHHLHTKSFKVEKPMSFVRNGTDVEQVVEGHIPSPAGSEPLMRLVQKDGSFWIDKAAGSSSPKKLWLVVRDLAAGGHKLADSDVIKLGRFKFRVRQMVVNEHSAEQPQLKLDDSSHICKVDGPENTSLDTVTCRICLLEGPADDDPLIAPCNCKGSIEYVHLACLRHWIKGRLNLSDTTSGSFFYRPLTCELCKSAYPVYIHQAEGKMPLVEVPRTRPPFIVLENMVRDSQQHATRGLHVVSLAEQKMLKLGRGHESDVRIADVSISRCHATIRFHRGQFLLEDHNSKFGTLVAMKKPRALEASQISIQVGRTVLSLHVCPAQGEHVGGGAPLQPPQGSSSAQHERALRLSLLTRGGSSARDTDHDEPDSEAPP